MSVSQEQIKRINELARKEKSVGLTAEEKEEQKALRTAYITAFRESLRDTLEHTTIVEPDGSKHKLERGKKK